MKTMDEKQIYTELENLAHLVDPDLSFKIQGPEDLVPLFLWLRINVKYLKFDLEATRREVKFLGGRLKKEVDEGDSS